MCLSKNASQCPDNVPLLRGTKSVFPTSRKHKQNKEACILLHGQFFFCSCVESLLPYPLYFLSLALQTNVSSVV